MQMRFSGNAPPSGWPVADCFSTELVLAAANQNNSHMAAETVAILHLTLQLSPVAAIGQRYVPPEIEPD